jgi:dephospho-CoA kinase
MIVGITGTNGAGKGAVVDYLKHKGFKHYSARDFLTREVVKRGMVVDRSAMREVANEMRLKGGASFVIESLYKEALKQGGDAVIESVRAVGEVEFLKENGCPLIAVDADRSIRYKRAIGRGSATDKLDFDTWVMQEEREWHNTDEHDMNIPAVMALADYTITNEGSFEELRAQIDTALEQFKK